MKGAMRTALILGIIAGILFVGYQNLSESKKRFVKEIVGQVPYLIPRYFV